MLKIKVFMWSPTWNMVRQFHNKWEGVHETWVESSLRFVEGCGPCRWGSSSTQLFFLPVVHAQSWLSSVEGREAPSRSWWVPIDGPKAICPLISRRYMAQPALTLSWRQAKSLSFCPGSLYFLCL